MSILIKNVLHEGKIVNVYIEGNRFKKIGAEVSNAADITIDGSDKAILPAFYNTHCHAAMSILRGYSDDKPLFEWLSKDIWPIEDKLEAEDIYIASRLAILEMIKSGTVFFADMYFFSEATMQAVAEMGIRAATSIVEMDMFDSERTAAKKVATEEFLQYPNPCPERIIKCISCHAVYTVSDELLVFARDVAAQNNLYLQIHVSETAQENADCIKKCGMSPVAKLDSLGLLTPKTVLAHAVHLSDVDIEILHRRGCILSTNPVSNLKLNSGTFMFDRLYKKMPEQITLGTDGASSNNNLSMPQSMKFASLLAKQQADSAVAGAAADIFRVATVNGARSFGIAAGEIREGALADCLLVDLNNPFLVPGYNLVSNMVYAADSSCISDVICNGKPVMENYKVPGEKDIIAAARKLAEKIKNL